MKRLLTLILFTALTTLLHAQPNRGDGGEARGGREKFLEIQCNLISTRLKLDDVRKAKFVEIYKEFTEYTQNDKPRGGREGGAPHMKGGAPRMGEQAKQVRGVEGDTRSDEQIEQQMLESFDQSIKNIEVKREFYYKFREVLSPREIARMYELEREIRERMLAEQRQRQRPQQ